MGHENVDPVGAAVGGRGVEPGQALVDREHLGHGVDTDAGEVERPVRAVVGEVELGERVGQWGVGRARPRQAGRVMVAGDRHQRGAVGPHLPHRPLGDAERPVARPGMVEHVAQPQHDVGLEGQGEVDRRLEGLLEVVLALIGAVRCGARVVLAPEVGVTQGYDPCHGSTPCPCENDMLVTLHRGYDSDGAAQGPGRPAAKVVSACS